MNLATPYNFKPIYGSSLQYSYLPLTIHASKVKPIYCSRNNIWHDLFKTGYWTPPCRFVFILESVITMTHKTFYRSDSLHCSLRRHSPSPFTLLLARPLLLSVCLPTAKSWDECQSCFLLQTAVDKAWNEIKKKKTFSHIQAQIFKDSTLVSLLLSENLYDYGLRERGGISAVTPLLLFKKQLLWTDTCIKPQVCMMYLSTVSKGWQTPTDPFHSFTISEVFLQFSLGWCNMLLSGLFPLNDERSGCLFVHEFLNKNASTPWAMTN